MKSIFVLTALLAASRVASSLPFLTYGNENYDDKDSYYYYEHEGYEFLKWASDFKKLNEFSSVKVWTAVSAYYNIRDVLDNLSKSMRSLSFIVGSDSAASDVSNIAYNLVIGARGEIRSETDVLMSRLASAEEELME